MYPFGADSELGALITRRRPSEPCRWAQNTRAMVAFVKPAVQEIGIKKYLIVSIIKTKETVIVTTHA